MGWLLGQLLHLIQIKGLAAVRQHCPDSVHLDRDYDSGLQTCELNGGVCQAITTHICHLPCRLSVLKSASQTLQTY